jgi:hypothetical protein
MTSISLNSTAKIKNNLKSANWPQWMETAEVQMLAFSTLLKTNVASMICSLTQVLMHRCFYFYFYLSLIFFF